MNETRLTQRLRTVLEKEYGSAYKKVAGEIYRQIDAVVVDRHQDVDNAMDNINKALKGYGVEAMRGSVWVDNYYQDTNALYVNMGDSYVCTVIFDICDKKFYVKSIGEHIELKPRRFSI